MISGHEVLAFFEGQKLTPSGAISSSFGKQEHAGTRGFGLFLRLHDDSTHNISTHHHKNSCNGFGRVIKKWYFVTKIVLTYCEKKLL